MALSQIIEPATDVQAEAPPRKHLWTRDEYYRMADLGLFGPEPHVELIEGEIFDKVTQSRPHAIAIRKASAALSALFSNGFDIETQVPISLPGGSDPEPDIAVLRGRVDDYPTHPHPESVVLVVEVSDTSLAFDRGRKANLYAAAGIAEYWILNLPQCRLEICRDPSPEIGYKTCSVHTEADSVSPLGASGATVLVSDLLP